MSNHAVVPTSPRLRKLWRDGGAGLSSDGRPKPAGRGLNATDGGGPPRSGLAIGNDSARNRSIDEPGGAERLNADQFQSDSTR
jgi:hypothetical protein